MTSEILRGIAITMQVISLYYGITLYRNRRKLLSDLDEYAEQNPDESASEEELQELAERFKKEFLRPHLIMVILVVIGGLLGLIARW